MFSEYKLSNTEGRTRPGRTEPSLSRGDVYFPAWCFNSSLDYHGLACLALCGCYQLDPGAWLYYTVFNCGNYNVDYDKRSPCSSPALEEQLNNGCNYHTYEERLVVMVAKACGALPYPSYGPSCTVPQSTVYTHKYRSILKTDTDILPSSLRCHVTVFSQGYLIYYYSL